VMRVGNFHGLMDAMYAAMAGTPVPSFGTLDDGPIELLVNLARTEVKLDVLARGNFDFPSFDKRFVGQRTDHLITLRRATSMPVNTFGLNEVVSINRQKQSVQSFSYGTQVFAEEHLFVPTLGAPNGVGWVIGTAFRWSDQRTLLSVFNAQALADGPIAQAELPRGLPPGLHGLFVPQKG
jgi:all-trans-8'-apo-beta-carotenal 15,15'-oxygenase